MGSMYRAKVRNFIMPYGIRLGLMVGAVLILAISVAHANFAAAIQ